MPLAPVTPEQRYGTPALALHWLVALLIIAAIWAGYLLHDLPAFQRLRLVPLHKSLGAAALVLALARVAWHIAAPKPQPLPLRAWERRVSTFVHVLLYVLTLLVPFTGWLMSSALGATTVPFGLFTLPDLIGRDRELGENLKQVHAVVNTALMAAVVLHVLGAFKHVLIDRDGVMQRMLPHRKGT